MGPKTFFRKCLAQASSVVDQVKDSYFDQPSPCTDWNVEQLSSHMLYELSWIPAMITGKTISEVGNKYEGNLIKPSLRIAWDRAADLANRAVTKANLEASAHLSFGDHSNEYYIWQVGGEMLIHGWDLAEGIGKPLKFDKTVTEEFYKRVKPNADGFSGSGLFAKPVRVSDGADLQTKVLALLGRKINWSD